MLRSSPHSRKNGTRCWPLVTTTRNARYASRTRKASSSASQESGGWVTGYSTAQWRFKLSHFKPKRRFHVKPSKSKVSSILCIFLLSACTARLRVTHLETTVPTPRPALSNGIVYALPLTVVKVDLPVERSFTKPAPYRLYGPIFFPELVV